MRFRASLDRCLDEVELRPESFPHDVAPVRFARLNGFPYFVFFMFAPESVFILAVLHGASDPDKWRERVATG